MAHDSKQEEVQEKREVKMVRCVGCGGRLGE